MDLSLQGARTLFTELVSRHWLSALLVLVTLCVLITLALARWWVRRRWRRLLESDLEEQHELDVLPPWSVQDHQAMECIRQLRREVWDIPESDLRIGVEPFTVRGLAVVRAIAAIYHPSKDIPEYEATLVDSLNLVQRVCRRITRFAALPPWRLITNRKLSDYQRFYQLYRTVNDNPVFQALRQHRRLYRLARLALNLKNVSNPFYWAGRELSREGYFLTLRWFYLAFISNVGREAMKLYSGRHFQRQEERDATLVCYRLFQVTRTWDGPSPEEWAMLVRMVADHTYMEADAKVHILSRMAQQQLPADVMTQPLQTEIGWDWYRDGLKRLLKCEPRNDREKLTNLHRQLHDISQSR